MIEDYKESIEYNIKMKDQDIMKKGLKVKERRKVGIKMELCNRRLRAMRMHHLNFNNPRAIEAMLSQLLHGYFRPKDGHFPLMTETSLGNQF